MKRRYTVSEGRITGEEELTKACRTCGKSFPLTARYFKRKRNMLGLNKGWGPDCLVCASWRITSKLADKGR